MSLRWLTALRLPIFIYPLGTFRGEPLMLYARSSSADTLVEIL
jgi:hypothetical protein